jgi:hypothetical protein
MTLQDMESSLLLQLQQPGLTTFGSAPNFSTIPSPAYGKDRLDFYLNRWYIRVMGDMAEVELYVITNIFNSVANTYFYTIPSSPSAAPITKVLRVKYAPIGLNYTYEYKQGEDLISWDEYQRKYTAQGYLQQTGTNTATLPDVCAVSIDRTQIWFYPGSANSGDSISVVYAPLPSNNGGAPKLLANPTDVPVMPDDCHDLIVQGALSELWIAAREFQQAVYAKAQYDSDLKRIKMQYSTRSKGDIQSMPYPDYAMSMRYEG